MCLGEILKLKQCNTALQLHLPPKGVVGVIAVCSCTLRKGKTAKLQLQFAVS